MGGSAILNHSFPFWGKNSFPFWGKLYPNVPFPSWHRRKQGTQRCFPSSTLLSPWLYFLPGRSQQPQDSGLLSLDLQSSYLPCLKPSVAPQYPEHKSNTQLAIRALHLAQSFSSSSSAPRVLKPEFRGFRPETFLLKKGSQMASCPGRIAHFYLIFMSLWHGTQGPTFIYPLTQ